MERSEMEARNDMALAFERMLIPAVARPERPPQAEGGTRLGVVLIFTSVEATVHALRRAGALATRLNAHITLVVPQVVPYPLPLTSPPAAAAVAQSSSVAVVFVSVWTSEGMDLADLSLPNNQDALVSAVLEAWYPGQRGGEAIANILFGTVNPSGKLPITFPRSVADLPRPTIPAPADPTASTPFDVDYNVEGSNVGYKWFDSRGIEPLFPFGYGLSYTTFAISNAKVTPGSGVPGFDVSFDVQNKGTRVGAEVAQVYLGLPAVTGEPPRRLVGWQNVALEAANRSA